MPVKIYDQIYQGTDEWISLRCGLLTASSFNKIMTPNGKIADNDKTRAHAWELAAQRITKYVEPTYIGDNALRGHEDEVRARKKYCEHFSDVKEVGFITNDSLGFTLGYSPDGLVSDNGLIECKSRVQKYQIETICTNEVPKEHILQCQAALLISERQWIDYVSYSGGLPMHVIKLKRDETLINTMVEACIAFEEKIQSIVTKYQGAIDSMIPLIETERTVIQEMYT